MQNENKWLIILLSYAVLLISMGYIAFFYLNFNPVTQIGPSEIDLLANENSKQLIEQALREESKAFQMKRDLAIQSFNIILGAVLGFLSATAVIPRKKGKNSELEGQPNQGEDEI